MWVERPVLLRTLTLPAFEGRGEVKSGAVRDLTGVLQSAAAVVECVGSGMRDRSVVASPQLGVVSAYDVQRRTPDRPNIVICGLAGHGPACWRSAVARSPTRRIPHC